MRALRRLWLRAWNFATRRSGDQRLREEMEQHIALETAANIHAGMTAAEAHRAARIKFGSVEAVRESYHSEEGLRVMETILQNCVFALRMMRKSPGFTALAAITLALGIGATSAVFSLIQGVLLTPPPYQKPSQLVLVSAVRTDGHKMDSERGWAAQQWMDWNKNAMTLQGAAGYSWNFNFLIRNDGSQSMQGMNISKEYIRLMGLKPITGRLFDDAEYGPFQGSVKSVVLGYEFWQRELGGDPAIVGKTIRVSRWNAATTVIGVMEPGVRFLPSPGASKEPNYDVNATVDLWVPIEPALKDLKAPDWNVVARLRDGVTVQKAQQELAVLTAQQASSEKKFEGFTPKLQTVTAEMNQDGQKILYPLLGASALVLLIACGNVSALLLVRGLQRQQEYAIRIAMGMGRGALLRLIMTESLLLALIGGALGVGIAFGAVTMFKLIAIHAVPRLDAVTARTAVLGWGFAAAVVAAFIAGMIPALRVLRLDPMEVLKDGGSKGTAGVGERRLLRAVVVLQTSLTLALLVGAGLLIRTMAKIASAPSGYDTSRILTMSVTEVQNQASWNDFHHRALERVAALPGVQYAAFAWGVPLTGNNWPGTVEIEGQPPAVKESDKTALPLRSVTPDYFKLMGLALLNGRGFRSTDDGKAPQVAVVNKTFADRFFPGQTVIGRKIWQSGRDKPGIEIVGEIADGRTDDLTQQASPEVYLSFWQAGPYSKHLVIRTAADPQAIVAGVEREVRSVDPSAAIENVKTLEQIRDDSLASRTFVMRLLVGFSVIGSVLTLVGIYGVLSLSVVSRRRELAIRCAVGAQQSDLRRLIFNEGLQVIGGGVFFGVILALISSQVLSAFLYEVRPTDPATLLVTGLLFLGVGLLACWVPAWRAEKVHPIEALRYS